MSGGAGSNYRKLVTVELKEQTTVTEFQNGDSQIVCPRRLCKFIGFFLCSQKSRPENFTVNEWV